jgi:hypothetical protein
MLPPVVPLAATPVLPTRRFAPACEQKLEKLEKKKKRRRNKEKQKNRKKDPHSARADARNHVGASAELTQDQPTQNTEPGQMRARSPLWV